MLTLHSKHYTQAQYLPIEHQRIFTQSWIPIAHTSEFPRPGFALERSLLHQSMIVIKQQQGFRAFHNVCRHRAGPLLWPGEGKASRGLRCKYHGWRYNHDGKLTHTPDFGMKVCSEDYSLFPIATEIWNGLIFVNLTEQPSDFQAFICDLQTQAPNNIESFEFDSTARHTIRCNWKTYVENYLEGYHIPYLHPSLRASIEQSQYSVSVHKNVVTHHVPAEKNTSVEGFWAYLWPNTALNMYGEGMSIERILPLNSEQVELHYLYLFLPGCSQETKEQAIAMSRLVTEEDILICERVYSNLQGGLYTQGLLSPKHEAGVGAFQQWYRAAMQLP